jgi:hypothetical protein
VGAVTSWALVGRRTRASDSRSISSNVRWRDPIWWAPNVGVPLAVATIGVTGGLLIADRQITASRDDLAQQISASRKDLDRQLLDSRRQVATQIGAERKGRLSDARAGVYGGFADAAERHIDAIGSSEAAIRRTDREVFVALRLVELRGSARAYASARRIASRARRIHELFDQGGAGGASRSNPGSRLLRPASRLGEFRLKGSAGIAALRRRSPVAVESSAGCQARWRESDSPRLPSAESNVPIRARSQSSRRNSRRLLLSRDVSSQ